MFHVERCTYNDCTAHENAEGIAPSRVFSWRVAQPSDGKPHRGCPILRGFFAKGGWQSDPTMGFAFHAARARNEISPSPHSPAPARARPTDRRAITAPAPFLIPRGVPAPDFFLPGCGAYTAVSLDVSCPSKH